MTNTMRTICFAIVAAVTATQAWAVAVQKDYKVAMVPAYPRCNPTCSTTRLSAWTYTGGTVLIQKSDNLAHYDYSIHFTDVRNADGHLCDYSASGELLTLTFKVDATSANGSSRQTVTLTGGGACDDGEVNVTSWVAGGITITDGFYEVYDLEVYDSDADLLAVPGFRR